MFDNNKSSTDDFEASEEIAFYDDEENSKFENYRNFDNHHLNNTLESMQATKSLHNVCDLAKRTMVGNKRPSASHTSSSKISRKTGSKNYNDSNAHQIKKFKNSLQQKTAKSKVTCSKPTKNKSRNQSKNSLVRQSESESKTYNPVLVRSKKYSGSTATTQMISSPEENESKHRSDKAKSSLTSSTTTHTNNARKRKSIEKNAKRPSVNRFGASYMKEQKANKVRNLVNTASLFSKNKQTVSNYDKL